MLLTSVVQRSWYFLFVRRVLHDLIIYRKIPVKDPYLQIGQWFILTEVGKNKSNISNPEIVSLSHFCRISCD